MVEGDVVEQQDGPHAIAQKQGKEQELARKLQGSVCGELGVGAHTVPAEEENGGEQGKAEQQGSPAEVLSLVLIPHD